MITEAGNMIVYIAGYPAIMGLQPTVLPEIPSSPGGRGWRQSRPKRKNPPTLADASV